MDRLKFNTRESLYSPLEIEIDKVIYKHGKLTREFTLGLEAIRKRIALRDEAAIDEWIIFMFGVKPEVLASLDVREVEDIYVDITAKLQEMENDRKGMAEKRLGIEEKKDPPAQPVKASPGKNAKRSGEKKSS